MLASAIATLPDTSSRAYTLTLDGLDVLKQPAGASLGQRFGVPIETLTLVERGTGGVSGLEFVIEDPLGVIVIPTSTPMQPVPPRMLVRLFYQAQDRVIFLGWTDTWTPVPMNPTGRRITVTCVGVEIVLDWAKVAAFTVAPGVLTRSAVQAALANVANGTAIPLRAGAGGIWADGTDAEPVGGVWVTGATPLVIDAGLSLREAIRTILDDSYDDANNPDAWGASVDFAAGLRVYRNTSAISNDVPMPAGFTRLVINNSGHAPGGFGVICSNLEHTVDSNAPTAVMVIGTGGAITIVGLGGAEGDMPVITDTALDTADRRRAAGLAYLGQYREVARGSYDLEAWAGDGVFPAAGFRAGAATRIYDATIGVDTQPGNDFKVTEIEWRFLAGGSVIDRTVTYGALAPSLAGLARRLTRATLS